MFTLVLLITILLLLSIAYTYVFIEKYDKKWLTLGELVNLTRNKIRKTTLVVSGVGYLNLYKRRLINCTDFPKLEILRLWVFIKLLSHRDRSTEGLNREHYLYPMSAIYFVLLYLLGFTTTTFVTESIESTMLLSALVTALISLVVVTNRQSKYIVIIGSTYVSFVFLTYYFVSSENLFTFFIIYEMFLLPSSLLVWLFSPNKRGVKTSLFFLLWTQLGSMLILVGICLVRSITGSGQTSESGSSVTKTPASGSLSVLLGFLFKIPTFPFYFWLVKTHVEVMTSFSVFLSGFLVKIALFGLYKLMFLFTLFTKIIAVTLAMLSSLVTSVIFLFQMDIKKIVAYATIQEMGQLTVAAFMMHLFNIRTISMFLITHTVLSAKFFYISDVIYRQYSSRSGTVVTGLLSKSPKLSSAVVIGLVLFRGIPFTSKNSVEINLLNVLFGTDFSFGLFWLLLIIFVGNVTFSFVFLRTLVLGPIMQTGFIDLVQLDISIFILCTTILVSIPYLFF